MTLGAILPLECWKCFKMKSHTNGTQAKAKKKPPAFGLLYSCNLYSCHRHTDDLRSPVSRIRRRMNQRLTHSWSPRRISRGGRPWKAESLCIQLAKWAGTATSAASDRQQDISFLSILRKKMKKICISRSYSSDDATSNSTIQKSALECLSLSSIMLDKLLGETNLLFDSLNLKCIIGTAVHRFTCNMFFIVQHSTVYSSIRYVCYVYIICIFGEKTPCSND